MSRAIKTLTSRAAREQAAKWCMTAPSGTVVEFRERKRTLPQNARMWAMLTDVATQLKWHGQKLSPDDWKLVFLDALKREVRMVPALEGVGWVMLGRSSSSLTKGEMIDLQELIAAFGANHGVVFGGPEPETVTETADA